MERKLWILVLICAIIGAVAYALIGVHGIIVGVVALIFGLLIIAMKIRKGAIQNHPQPAPSQTSDPPNGGA